MPSILTCWKEIAAYLGKGVRTVQRLEKVAGLPIRRPSNRPSGTILAYPEELDKWLQAKYKNRNSASDSDVAKLRDRLRELENELERLRAENERIRRDQNSTWQPALQTGDSNR